MKIKLILLLAIGLMFSCQPIDNKRRNTVKTVKVEEIFMIELLDCEGEVIRTYKTNHVRWWREGTAINFIDYDTNYDVLIMNQNTIVEQVQ